MNVRPVRGPGFFVQGSADSQGCLGASISGSGGGLPVPLSIQCLPQRSRALPEKGLHEVARLGPVLGSSGGWPLTTALGPQELMSLLPAVCRRKSQSCITPTLPGKKQDGVTPRGAGGVKLVKHGAELQGKILSFLQVLLLFTRGCDESQGRVRTCRPESGTHLPCWKCLMLGLGCPFWVSCCSQEMPVTQVVCAVGRPGITQPPSQGRGPELGLCRPCPA